MKTLQLSDKDINILMFALQKLPYENVAPLIANIHKQVSEQPKTQSDDREGNS